MDISMAIGLLCIGGCIGGLLVVGWTSPKKPLRDTFNEMHHAPENIEQRARRIQ